MTPEDRWTGCRGRLPRRGRRSTLQAGGRTRQGGGIKRVPLVSDSELSPKNLGYTTRDANLTASPPACPKSNLTAYKR